MRLLFDDELIESVVFLCALGKGPGLPPLQVRRFHRERERAYSVLDPDERNAAFSRVHAAWFHEWGLDQCLARVIAGFPLLDQSLQAMVFRKARNKSEEAADLYVNANGENHGIVALHSERFANEVSLRAFLNHELMHVSDMVDPAFGYSRDVSQFGETASKKRLVQERYRLLWDVTIDGRLTRLERATVASLERRRDEFERAYSFLDADRRRALFESLWIGPSPQHQALLDVARDPRGLTGSRAQAPGAPCPLCGFAAFAWVEGSALKPHTVSAIKKEFPSWTIEESVCHRCVEIYEAPSGLELPATICL
ncbi:MAG: hypothetical protein HYY23_21220 [Verrucomicrobia bacterium]|nr:hypothetical protein [Verrucomicrobiota bacterium]